MNLLWHSLCKGVVRIRKQTEESTPNSHQKKIEEIDFHDSRLYKSIGIF